MTQNFSKYISVAFLLISLNGCSRVSSTENQTASDSAHQNVAENTPEQVIKEYTEIAFRADLDIIEKHKKVEECCTVAAQPYVPHYKEANAEYVQKMNSAISLSTGIPLLYDELAEVEKRCENDNEAVYGALFRVKGQKYLDSNYFVLKKENNRWRIADLTFEGIPKCASNQVADNLN